jgi:hypothetical protein
LDQHTAHPEAPTAAPLECHAANLGMAAKSRYASQEQVTSITQYADVS